jgi:hypothetical protein
MLKQTLIDLNFSIQSFPEMPSSKANFNINSYSSISDSYVFCIFQAEKLDKRN